MKECVGYPVTCVNVSTHERFQIVISSIKESSFTLLVPFSLPLCRIEPVKFLISIAIWERIWYIHLTLIKPAYSFCSFVIREPKTALAQETISGVTQVLLDNSTKSQLAAMLEGNSTKDDV